MIELMIVVAIIGILAAIALPKFADMIEKAKEGSTHGQLRALRSAAAIYYSDAQGVWPTTLDCSSSFRYSQFLDVIPQVKVTGKFDTNTVVHPMGNTVSTVAYTLPTTQSTGWMYDSTSGVVYVNSTLTDFRKVPYSFYGFD